MNTAKFSFSANQIPKTLDLTEAFFERWLPVTCPNKFISGVNADAKISKKIQTEDELSGALNWALEGLKRLLANGKFTTSRTAAEVQTLWEESSESVASFNSKCLAADTDSEIIKKELHYTYNRYCSFRKFVAEGIISFGRTFPPKLSYEIAETQPTIKGKREHAWKGVKLLCGACPNYVENLDEDKRCTGCTGYMGTLYRDGYGTKITQAKLIETSSASSASRAGAKSPESEKPPEGHGKPVEPARAREC